eukprot:scaffold35582_cov48-Phaeocystis_antarctica.AAC.1
MARARVTLVVLSSASSWATRAARAATPTAFASITSRSVWLSAFARSLAVRPREVSFDSMAFDRLVIRRMRLLLVPLLRLAGRCAFIPATGAVHAAARQAAVPSLEGGDLAAAQAAVADGASVRARDDDGGEPLHRACAYGHLDIAQWLHSAGASLDATDTVEWTPLHVACYCGQLEIAQWLCSAGADATLKTINGDTPAQLLQHHARTSQLDQQALRSTLACLTRGAQAQGPLPCSAAPVQALTPTPLRLAQVQRHRVLRRPPPPHPARARATALTC